MQWLRSRKPVAKTVYIPIAASTKPYAQLWCDKQYLESVRDLGKGQQYINEVLEALRIVRDAADEAQTPEELRGVQTGIKAIKNLLALSYRAESNLSRLAQFNKDQRAIEEEHDDIGAAFVR